jgi:hypothetical protein
MLGARNFVPDLARAGKNYKEIKALVNAAYGDQSYQKTIVNAILKKMKAGKSPADICLLILKKNQDFYHNRLCYRNSLKKIFACTWRQSLLPMVSLKKKIIFNILHKGLGLENRSARWVPN